MSQHRIARFATATLMGGASLLTLTAAAHAQSVTFSTSSELASGSTLDTGREVSTASGTVQVRLPGGAVASFVDAAQFSLRADGSVDLRSGSVTVVGKSGATTAVHMPEGVQGTIAGASAATFTANASGSRGSTTAGTVSVVSNGVTRSFAVGQFWTAGANRAPDRVIAGSAAAVPNAREGGPVRSMREGGVAAAAENGIPVALGEGLAGVGARGDVVAAARRIEAYDANPTIAAFPTGDYATLVQYAAQANGLFGAGGTTFNGAGADIIRTYFEYLAAGNAGANFRTAYAQVLLNYLDLLRSGVLPSTFKGATQTQLGAYLAFIGRTDGFGSLSAANRQLLDAYLAFLSTNGSPDAFGASVTNLTTSFLNFVRGGGNPASFTQASATVVSQYLAIVNSGGLRTNLTAQNQALLAAYLANNGIGFTTTYATGLAAFVAYLNTGGLPSGYAALPAATVRQYLETLETTGLFDSVLGTQSAFLRSYLVFLRGGGTADQFNALPINVARVNASNLSIYVEYLLAGGAPTAYTALTQAQIRAALDQLTATGQFNALLGINAAFLSEYYAYIRTGADADTFAGLPSVDVNAYAASLQLFAAYLRGGALPSGYTALTAQQIRSYLTALQVGGKLTLLGDNAALLGDYLTYIRTGGAPDAFSGLPIVTYTNYATALGAYFAYLNAGGLPSGYTALTQAQLRTYLDVLKANGQFTLLGSNTTFYTDYLAYLAGGGAVDAFAGLPIVTFQGYAAALSAYFAYLNAGGLPSGYTVLTQAQVRQYLDALSANAGLTALLGGNAAFFTQYRAYLLTGASVDAFAGLPIVTYQSYATALSAYYAFLLGGGTPSAYTALSQTQIRSYLDALKAAGQVTALLGANSAFFTQYLAFLETGGAANAYPGLPSSTYGQYASALSAYFTFLNGGGLPSGYTALTQAQIREYLSVLQANNQLAALLGANATFFANYLTFVSSGGVPDAFAGLPIVTYTNYASALTAYYAYLAGGGLPANYTALTQAQIRTYLDALDAANQIVALLGQNATFFANYQAYLASGGAPNGFSGLPSVTYANYSSALQAFVAFLRGNGLPGGYTALTSAQIREYLAVLQANGQLGLIGSASDQQLLTAYAAYLATGGVPNQFAGLPAFVTYEAALRTYYAFLQGGGKPSAYTALTQAQIVAYIGALDAAGLVAAKLTAAEAKFLRDYAAYVSAGSNPDQFAGLPGNQPIGAPVVTQGLANAPRSIQNVIATAMSGKNLFSAATTTGTVNITGDNVNAITGTRGVTNQTAKTVEARTVDNTVAIARWSEGTFNTESANNQVGAQQGVHMVWGTPATAVPTTGTATFGMIAATSPTRDGGEAAPGTFTGNLGVAFDTKRVGWDSVIGIGGVNYRFASEGGIAAPSIAIAPNNTFNGTASTASNGLAGSGTGFFAGVGGNLIGFAYVAQGPGVNGEIEGTAIFGRGAPAVTLPAVTPPVPTTPVVTQGLADAPRTAVASGAVGKAFTSAVNDGGMVTINGNSLTAYSGASLATAVDVATVEARTVDGAIALARWGSGTWKPEAGANRTLLANEGLHFVWGAPATTIPTTGTAIFGLVTATAPTVQGGAAAPGTFAGNLALNFASRLVGLDSRITIGGVTYAYATTGGTTSPSLALGSTGQFNGVATTANFAGNGLVNGFLSGAGGAYAGLIYSAVTPIGTVDGSAIFGRNQVAATLPAATYTGAPQVPVSLPAPTYSYTAGLATSGISVRSIYPGTINNQTTVSLTNANGRPVTRDSNGGLQRVGDGSFTSDITRGTAKVADIWGDTRVAIGRWYDGTYTRRESNGDQVMTLGAAQSLHYVQLAPGSFTMPTTGQVNYTLFAATQPTLSTGTVGAGLFDGKMALAFGSSVKVALEGTIRMPESSGTVTYAFSTPGGVAGIAGLTGQTFSNNVIAVTAPITGTGVACTTNCQLNFSGGFGGSDVNRIGATYYTSDARGFTAPSITGAAVFQGTMTDGTTTTPSLPAPNYAYAAGQTNSGLYIRQVFPSDTGNLNFQIASSATRDAQGGLQQTNAGQGAVDSTRGTAKVTDIFGDTRAVIGRWYDGTYNRGTTTSSLSATQSLHYLLLSPPGTFALPTSGQVNYSLLAATQPTYSTGATGAGLFDGKMALLFGSSVKVALEGTIRMPESSGTVTYAFATPGGVAGVNGVAAQTFSNNVIAVTAPMTGSGLACTTSCQLNFSGGFGGSDVSRIGAVYFTSDSRGASAPSIQGAAIFAGTPLTSDATTLSNQRVAFASSQNSNTGAAPTVELNAAGAIQRVVFQNGPNTITDYKIGTSTAFDSGKVDNVMAWTRWGAASGAIDSATFHVVAGTPATALPATGTVNYAMIGSTRPTDEVQRGALGTISGSAAVLFGAAPKVGLDLNVAVSGKEWKLGTTGGLTNIAQSELTVTTANMGFQAAAVRLTGVSGGACSGFCNAYVGGALYGAGASHMGLTYVIDQGSGSSRNYVTGSAAFAATPGGGTGGGTGTPFTGTLQGQTTYAYAGGSLIDQGISSVTYDADKLRSYQSFLFSKTQTGPSNVAGETGRLAETIGWTRWTGDSAGPLTNQGPNAGVHLMSGTPTAVSTLPSSGTVQYTMVGGTKPTLGNASAAPGTLTGTLAVAFGSLPRIGLDLTATVGGFGWRVQTTGGSANPSTSQLTVGAQGTFSGSFGKTTGSSGTTAASCVTACTATIGGQMYGSGASHVGVAFNMTDSGPTGVAQASAVGIFAKNP